jgi:hypothetical protein
MFSKMSLCKWRWKGENELVVLYKGIGGSL